MVVENDENQHDMDDEADDYGDEENDEDGMPVNSSAVDLNNEELEAIIESITSGKS